MKSKKFFFSASSLLSLVFAIALPMAAQAQPSGSCTCTCTFQTSSGPETQAIPSTVGEGVTEAEATSQCQSVCDAESTRRRASSVTINFGSCPAGTFPASASAPSTDTGSSGGGTAGSIALYNPLGPDIGVAEFISRGLRTVIGFVGALALLMFVYGGVMWMTAGDSKRIDTAKEILKNSTIGLLLIFFSYSIVSVVFSLLGVI